MTDEPIPPDLDVDIPSPTGLHVTTGNQPYHLLLVGDFAGSGSGTVSGPLRDGVVAVTADSLHELMRTACPSVNLKTTDPLAGGNAMVEIPLAFDSFKAFDPRLLIGQITPTKSLAAIRARIVERMHGKATPETLNRAVGQAVQADASLAWLAESMKWTPAAPAASAGAVDDLLGQLDLGDGSAGDTAAVPPKSPIGKAVAAAAGTGIPAEEASALRRTLAEVDRRLSAWLTAVLHAPPVQSMEAAWRSLAFFVSKIDFRKGVRLSVLHAAPAEFLERVRTKLIDPVFDEGAPAPDVILVDRSFGQTGPEIEALDELAQHAASLPAVVIVGASPQFFGVKYGWQMPTLPAMRNHFDQWQFAKWRTLRAEGYARALGVVVGRGLLRPPHSRGEAAALEFAYAEPCIAEQDLVWANGSIVAGCAIAASVAESGWPTGMSGYVHGRVEGFQSCQGGKKGDKKFGPSDVVLQPDKIEEIGMVGVNVVACPRDLEEVLVWNGMTAAYAPADGVSALLEVTLPYQLFARRLSGLLFSLKPLLSSRHPDRVVPIVTQHVRDWVSFGGQPTPEQLSVQARPAEDDPTKLELAVTVTPPPQVLPGEIPVVMGYRIGP